VVLLVGVAVAGPEALQLGPDAGPLAGLAGQVAQVQPLLPPISDRGVGDNLLPMAPQDVLG
jgi:hypothetical protein